MVGIAPAPAGIIRIAVTFELDMNGNLHVSAKDQNTGKDNSIKIHNDGWLIKEEIDQIQKDVEAHYEEDKRYQELIEAKHDAHNIINASKKGLEEYSAKIHQDVKDKVKSYIEALNNAINSGSIDDIRASTHSLKVSSQKIGEAIYGNNGAQTQAKEGEVDTK